MSDAPPDVHAALDARVLPDGVTELVRIPFRDGAVAVEWWDQSGTIYIAVTEAFTGGGEGLVGGSPGETWQGCWRSDYSDAGYALITVADPAWSVDVNVDGWRAIDLLEANGLGIALIPGDFDRPVPVRARDAVGAEPSCVRQ